jgi:hypothetical protein
MKRQLFLVAIPIVVALVGGSSGGASCGTFTPCGGSVVGTWKVTTLCLDFTTSTSTTCPDESVSEAIQPSGTITFTSSGTYSVAVVMNGSAKFGYPSTCLGNLGMTCAQIDSALQKEGATDAGVSGSCASGAAGSCTCSEKVTNAASSETGTYTTTGSSIAMISSSSTSSQEPTEYCVQGNKLTLHSTNTAGSSSIILTK